MSPRRSTWNPILSGATERLAREAIDAAARDLRHCDWGGQPTDVLWSAALLFGYLAAPRGDSQWSDDAVACLNLAGTRFATDELPSDALFDGISGFAWAAEHLAPAIAGETGTSADDSDDSHDPLVVVDQRLLGVLETDTWRAPYDLVRGLVGIATYLIERMPRPASRAGLSLVLSHLERLAEGDSDTATWHTAPHHLPAWQREVYPNGCCDIGVAHGVPGVLQILAELTRLNIQPARARDLLERGMRWLLTTGSAANNVSSFYSRVAPDTAGSTTSQLGWCYGDLGVAAVLHNVGTRVGRADWRDEADRVMAGCVRRSAGANGVIDTGLCHGAFGVAHIFNRVYQATGSEPCRAAARTWFERGLLMLDPGNGAGGFFSCTTGASSHKRADLSFLLGATGSALSLIAAVGFREPAWDRILLLSGRD